MSEEPDDAQRVLEKKALKNVRDLVDKLEADERDRTAGAGRLAVQLVVVVVLVMAIAAPVVYYLRSQRPKAVVYNPAATRSLSQPEYVEQALAKIERLANTRNADMMIVFTGRVQLTFTIGADGYTKNIEVSQSSWNTAFDGAVTKIVKVSEPFGLLPDAVRKEADFLKITRTFRIARADSRAALIIERDPGK
jgi:TonB family protein